MHSNSLHESVPRKSYRTCKFRIALQWKDRKKAQPALRFCFIFSDDLKLDPVHTPMAPRTGGRMPVGVSAPLIQAAIEANDAFIERLEAIRDRAQTLTIE